MIASNRIEVEGPRYAQEHLDGVNKNNLISIPRAPQQLNHQQRQQPVILVLLNVRSIRKKTLLLRDYIAEHDIDLLAITETWLTDHSSDEFYCRDICPEGYKIEQLPRNYADGGGVALVYRRCFKVKKDVQTALERRWRSSKRECDSSRFKEQCLRVNALIKKLKWTITQALYRRVVIIPELFSVR